MLKREPHPPGSVRHGGGSLLPVDVLGGCSGRRLSPAKLRRRWDNAYKCCDAVLLVLGLVLAWLAASSFAGPSARHGVLLGCGVAALGALGLAAAAGLLGRPALWARSLVIVGLAFCVLSTSDLMQQVGRDVGTHCALAEAHTRIRHLEERVEKMRHDEMITQLFFRMNEMDDMLSAVQASSTEVVKAHGAVWRAAQADRDYLRAKVGALRRHAASVADALRAKVAEAKANSTASDGGGSLSDQLWGVERRVEAVDSVVRYLDQKEAAGDLSFEEYELILEALLEGSSGHLTPATMAVLQSEKGGLGAVKAAYDRQAARQPCPCQRHASQSYDHVANTAGGGSGASVGAGPLTRTQARKESSRQHFENRFMEILNAHGAHHGPAFRASLAASLESLPEHCVRDVAAHGTLHSLGWALLVAQLAGIYAALTALVHAASKDE